MAPAPSKPTIPRFTTTPPELRNRVYDHVFANPSTQSEVDITRANPPSKDLTMVNKQVHAESYAVYKHHYQRYWKETHFASPQLSPDMSFAAFNEILKPIRALKAEDVAAITHISLHGDIGWRLMADGVWCVGSRNRYLVHGDSQKEGKLRFVDVGGMGAAQIEAEKARIGRTCGVTKFELLCLFAVVKGTGGMAPHV